MNKINLYVFTQIIKSCTLVFFIFISIAWLMQLSRLFSITNNLQIGFLQVFGLSLWLIPNLFNITMPFILIFGLVLTFIKFDRDKEIVAFYSLGISLNEIKKPIILIFLITILMYLSLNFFLSPYTYNIYKEKEFTLRNSIEFNKINISNFIEIDNNLIIDFENNEKFFEDVFINFHDKEENLIFSKNGTIDKKNDKLIFSLNDGFKLVIKNNEIEKLKFDNYKIEFPNKTKNEYSKFDKNTIDFFELINERTEKNNKIIIQRLFDILILTSFILYFYLRVIVKNNYSLYNFILFIVLSIFCLILDNFIENFSINKFLLIALNLLNILFLHFFSLFQRFIYNEK